MTAKDKADLRRIVDLLSAPWSNDLDACERMGRAQAVAEMMLERSTAPRESLRGRALSKLWAAWCAYQELENDEGDCETFCDFVREELPGLMPVSGG